MYTLKRIKESLILDDFEALPDEELLVKYNGLREAYGLPSIDLKSFKSVDLLIGRAIVIHSGGDNYSDNPEKLGGGKNRIACGVIK
jgi:Cu/Zn superoxide dismutase